MASDVDRTEYSVFAYGEDDTSYEKYSDSGLVEDTLRGEKILVFDSSVLRKLAEESFYQINHFLRPSHLKFLSSILDDPEASANDRVVAMELLKNACIASGGVLPMCQDTGTAIVLGMKGSRVLSFANDAENLSLGVLDAYQKHNLRYSQLSPLSMYQEKNTQTNLPADIQIISAYGPKEQDVFSLLFMAKGGGSANKMFLYQAPPSILSADLLHAYIKERLYHLGTSACPPYHLAVVIGGLSGDMTMKTLKLASARYLDGLPTAGGEKGLAFRDLEEEKWLQTEAQGLGIGAQFGGKYFCHDARVIRLPRHAASLPIGIGVSCSADRQQKVKITKEGIWIEKLEKDPAHYLPEISINSDQGIVDVDLNQGMAHTLKILSSLPVASRLRLHGYLVVARDSAHAKLRDILQKTGDLPSFFKEYPIYYAGPAKTPSGMTSGSFGPTTAGRMDGYVESFQAVGASLVSLAKGNRSEVVRDSCRRHGGFYLGSIGGAAARLAQDCIKEIEVIAYPELGMEAIRRIRVENFPAFIIIDSQGNDFFARLKD